MFNEAFWFFYMLGLFDKLPVLFFSAAAALSIGMVIWGMAMCDYHGLGDDEFKTYIKWLRWAILTAALLVVLGVMVPSQESLYAGAGQYAVEATGTDDTLMQLKELIDQKIEEARNE